MEKILTVNNFEAEVKQAKGLVLVDFWASWCGPCKMLAPIVSEVAERNASVVTVGKVNVDEEPQLAMEYGISSIPTLILFKDGQPVKKSIGYVGAAEIESMWK